jgi:hypothetical protein
MKVLSLIVPSYNSERFLDKGIPSFLHPEVIDKLDVIIVNDGSGDATPEVAKKYCDSYPGSIRLINQENKGHGGALNTGCAAAVGKYLKVIDADDWVETENLPEFIRLLESCESDVVLTHHHTIDISTGDVKKWKSYPAEFGRGYTLEEIMGQWKNFDRSLTLHGITYKTEFYHRCGIQLSEHVFYEDHEFATFPCCMAERVTPFDLFIYEYRIGDVQQSVSDENQLKRIGHTETVLRRLVAEYHKLTLVPSDAGRDYVCMKAQGLLMSYLTTVLLVNPDKKQGREMAQKMMAFFHTELPGAYEKAKKQYAIFRMLNCLHVSRKTFEAVLHSKAYNRLRKNHDFE